MSPFHLRGVYPLPGFSEDLGAFPPKFKSQWSLYFSKVIFGIINTAKLTQVDYFMIVLHSDSRTLHVKSTPFNTTWPRVIEKHASRPGKYLSLFVSKHCNHVRHLTFHRSMVEVSERDHISGEKIRTSMSLSNNSHFDIWVCSSPDHQGPSVKVAIGPRQGTWAAGYSTSCATLSHQQPEYT